MLNKKSVDDINVNGKRVLCRCDFNVPLDGDKITDETRLVAALPTIKKLIADGGKVILCSHLGKPKGEAKHPSHRVHDKGTDHEASDIVALKVAVHRKGFLHRLLFKHGNSRHQPDFLLIQHRPLHLLHRQTAGKRPAPQASSYKLPHPPGPGRTHARSPS